RAGHDRRRAGRHGIAGRDRGVEARRARRARTTDGRGAAGRLGTARRPSLAPRHARGADGGRPGARGGAAVRGADRPAGPPAAAARQRRGADGVRGEARGDVAVSGADGPAGPLAATDDDVDLGEPDLSGPDLAEAVAAAERHLRRRPPAEWVAAVDADDLDAL